MARALVLSALGLLPALATSLRAQQLQPLGAEFRVNSTTIDNQRYPSIAREADQDFVVVWTSDNQDGYNSGIFGQRFQSSGAPLGQEFQVNSYTTNRQSFPSVSSDADGDFVVVWESRLQDGSQFGIFGQRYLSSGVALGEEFRVNSFTTSYQRIPAVSSEMDGDFVVVWQSDLQNDGNLKIAGQRYLSSGSASGQEFRISSFTASAQQFSSVSSDTDGDFVVVWQSYLQDGSADGVFGQRYLSSGAALGQEFRVNSSTTGYQRAPAVSLAAGGDFVVLWNSNGQDGSLYGVFGQRYRQPPPVSTQTPPPTETPTSTPLSMPSGPGSGLNLLPAASLLGALLLLEACSRGRLRRPR